jgi:sugar lactone lactonase YvrE
MSGNYLWADPDDLALDQSGNVYVLFASPTNMKVEVFAPGQSSVLRTVSTAIPAGVSDVKVVIGVDVTGRLYVFGSWNMLFRNPPRYLTYASYSSYAPGATSPLRTLTFGAGAGRVTGLGFDRVQNVYIEYLDSTYPKGAIKVFAPELASALPPITQGVYLPTAIAFDTNGTLYVDNSSTITEYAAGSTSVLRTLHSGVSHSDAIALDHSNNLYVGNDPSYPAVPSVSVYAPGKTSSLRQITKGIVTPTNLVFDRSGYLYVLNDTSVAEYAPGAASPSLTITKGIYFPQYIVVRN